MGNNSVGVGLDVEVLTDQGDARNLLRSDAGEVDRRRTHRVRQNWWCQRLDHGVGHSP